MLPPYMRAGSAHTGPITPVNPVRAASNNISGGQSVFAAITANENENTVFGPGKSTKKTHDEVEKPEKEVNKKKPSRPEFHKTF